MKKRSPGFTLKDKFGIGITLVVVLVLGFIFFYINALAILELLHINPQLLTDNIIRGFYILLIGSGLWLILPVKIRVSIEALIYSFGRVKHKFITMNDSYIYRDIFATKVPPSLPVRLIGVLLISAGIAIWYFSR